LKYTGE